MMICFKFDVI